MSNALSDSQFSEAVSRRHEANSPFNADEIESMSDSQYYAVLNDVATRQRGGPERAMIEAQTALGGGLRAHSLEHIGDLPHRMNESFATKSGFSSEFVTPKVDTQLRALNSGYGYDREVGEQESSYRRSMGETADMAQRDDEVRRTERDYVLGHSQLPAYTEPGYHAKAAAVHIGLGNSAKSAEHLGALESFTSDPARYKDAMSRQGSVRWLRSQELPPQ